MAVCGPRLKLGCGARGEACEGLYGACVGSGWKGGRQSVLDLTLVLGCAMGFVDWLGRCGFDFGLMVC